MSKTDVGLEGELLPSEEVGPKTESTGNPLKDINNAFSNILSNLGPESELNEELEKALGPNIPERREALYGDRPPGTDPLTEELEDTATKIRELAQNIGKGKLTTAFGNINTSTMYLYNLTNPALKRSYEEGGEFPTVGRTPTDGEVTAAYLYGMAA